MSVQHSIATGLAELDANAPPTAARQLNQFIDQLARWNRVYNLTAVREPEAMVTRHIFDSLSILPWLRGPQVLDVGSGAGLPGIPLAIVEPTLQFQLLDSNAKRTRFMTQMVHELALDNVQVIRSRAEDFQPLQKFDCIITRAFGSIEKLLLLSRSWGAAHSQILAMKGQQPEAELQVLPKGYRLLGVHRLAVVGLDAERHLVQLALEPVHC